ncbi:hypothetical protein BCR43DRAFT_479733 [Syncephalastrum racemosum]|uniref:Phosphatase activator n=1 Tax=Syncephalastrum racemosum TaxID=13706 RepID=A0A1X2H100_SYNRA|nr:hypothetical protein BCR43DRAFT_479733 [Syncephalastrum racemosum]
MKPNAYEDLIYQQRPGGYETDEDDYDHDEEEEEEENEEHEQDELPALLRLEMRGTRMDLDRDMLVSLPESLLLAMFPNGLVLSGDTHPVDFDPRYLEHVLQAYCKALSQHHLINHPLLASRQPIIILREDLEYFCVQTKKKNVCDAARIKLECGDWLRKQDTIFCALEKNIQKENNAAEQHLIDMLCEAGFDRRDRWGHRALEPLRTCVMSVSLVLLDMAEERLPTAQKLLLFWRKPARKCWWDSSTLHIKDTPVRVWARRTWTLELALV